jgi:hypothetical protein
MNSDGLLPDCSRLSADFSNLYEQISEADARKFVDELVGGLYHCDCPQSVPYQLQRAIRADDHFDKTS